MQACARVVYCYNPPSLAASACFGLSQLSWSGHWRETECHGYSCQFLSEGNATTVDIGFSQLLQSRDVPARAEHVCRACLQLEVEVSEAELDQHAARDTLALSRRDCGDGPEKGTSRVAFAQTNSLPGNRFLHPSYVFVFCCAVCPDRFGVAGL